MEGLTSFAKKALATAVDYTKETYVKVAERGHELVEVTRETIALAITDTKDEPSVVASKQTNTADTANNQEGEGTQAKALSISKAFPTVFSKFKMLPALGPVMIMLLLLVQSGRVGNKKRAFIQELLSSCNKKHLRLLLAAAMSFCFLSGRVLPRLKRAHCKVLADKEADRVPLSDDDSEVKGEVGVACHKGFRNHMEDRVLVADIEPSLRLKAVIDGHGGSEAADFIQGALVEAVREASPWAFHSKKMLKKHFSSLLKNLEGSTNSSGLSSGCVLCIVLQKGRWAFIANLGDCQVVGDPLEGKGAPYLLSSDPEARHPNAAVEQQRIEAAGATLGADGTVHGLAVSRCLGDFWLTSWEKPAGLSIEPEVSIHNLQNVGLMVLMTDGVACSKPNAMAPIRKSLRGGEPPEEAAVSLADSEGGKDGSDNVGVVVVMLARPEPLPVRQAPSRLFNRGFKLDLTASASASNNNSSNQQQQQQQGQ